MSAYVDLHSHWVAGVDDGARTADDGYELLLALSQAGFGTVIATPHMRPGMFDNERAELEAAYERTLGAVRARAAREGRALPQVGLGSEHFFDDVVLDRLARGLALPYPGGHAILLEFSARQLPAQLHARMFELRRRKLRPVIAHPERYEPVWDNTDVLDPLIDAGAVLLLDVGALAGKYGRAPKRAAEALVEQGAYYAACSDAHTAKDVAEVVAGMARLERLAGKEEALFLLHEGPTRILEGRVEL
jgi:protein-tyrosine phosphatase